ncbi:MAG: ATPase [Acidobacteria bacterium]|nr:ATPase [Acidobacteriota bacterium]
MAELYLGVDGGQSSTTAVVADESGRVTGYGRGGPCNHVSGSEARTRFIDAIGSAVEQASGGARSFRAACFGFSGGPADKQRLIEEMFHVDQLLVTTDALIALSGATGGEPGIITIAGTGSIAFGRNAAGRTARAGGWGYVFGDEGGGFNITRQAVRAALRQHEGWGPRTMLHDRLLAETGARDANEMMHWFYTPEFPKPRIAGYARFVDECARAGDMVALDILRSEAQHLATFAGAVRGQLFSPAGRAVVAHIGGVFKSAILLERYQLLVELTDGNMCQAPRYGPAAGALIEAFRLAGQRVTLTDPPDIEK